jgi:penicillin amidase
MKTIVARILISFFAVFAASSLAQVPTERVTNSGLREEVTVRRDARDIPYIEAKNDADLYFAQGYVTASDRLWQMDLMRRLARGELAEIFGDRVLDEDKRWRRFGFAAIAQQSMTTQPPELTAALRDYAHGVNAYIDSLTDENMPVEFRILQYRPRHWEPTDTFVIGKILADALSTTWRNDLIRASIQSLPTDKVADLTNQTTPYDVVLFGKDHPANKRSSTEVPPAGTDLLAMAERDERLRVSSLERVGLSAEGLAASNNWVISGKHTADGKPLLANDPHLAPSAPGIWYLAHLSSPALRVSGVTVPGVPGVILGHNEFIAWGATNVGPDVQDLYYETFNANGLYKTPTGWEKPVVHKEEIKVRSNPVKTDTRSVDMDVTETRNGVVILEDSGKKYSLKWTARDPANSEFAFFFAANRAHNWQEFKNALKTYGGATQNFVYADVKGNIGWYAAGRIPIRRTGDGSLPYDGSTSDGDWTGFIPFDELPNLYNPPNGLIVTANQRIVGTDYKYTQMSRDAAPPWRARRIYDLLSGKSSLTMDNVRDVQYDSYNLPLANLASEIVKLKAASPQTLSLLKDWDGRMTADSPAAVIVNEIRGCLADRMADENKPAPSYVIRERVLDKAVREQQARWLPAAFKTYGDLITSCDAGSRANLADPKRLGPDDTKWTWGRVFQSRFPHPLAGVPFIGGQFATPVVPLDGSGQSPNVGSNVSMRHIASPGDWDQTRQIVPMGESGDPKSPHFRDQFEAWRTGTPMVFPFTAAAVERATVRVTVMSPH